MYFKRWWENQNDTVKSQFKQLVIEGRWEFVNGGWVASDEACPSIRVPKFAWHVDAFGHSSGTAQMFINLGYKGLFFGRMSDETREYLSKNGGLEFNWNPKFETLIDEEKVLNPKFLQDSQNLQSKLFTHLLFNQYKSPVKEALVSPDNPYQDVYFFYDMQLRNIYANPQNVIDELLNATKSYSTNNLLWAYGDDFAFQQAKDSFQFIDQVISIIQNKTDKVIFKFSTLQEYYEAVQNELKQQNKELFTYENDFMPLQEYERNGYWSGYYTSRPNLKQYINYMASSAESTSNIFAVQHLSSYNYTSIDQLINLTASLIQTASQLYHHDAITGTSQKRIVEDYLCELKSNEKLQCPNQDQFNESDQLITFVAFNPSLNPIPHIQLTLPSANYSASYWNIEKQAFELIFDQENLCQAKQLWLIECDLYVHHYVQPFQMVIFQINKTSIANQIEVSAKKMPVYTIKNQKLSISVDSSPEATDYNHQITQILAFQGKQVSQIVVHFEDKIQQESILKIILHDNSDQIEFDLDFAGIPESSQGLEVVATWQAVDFDSNDIFYTDSNGLGMIKKTVYRGKIVQDYPNLMPSANYYPITSGIMVQDEVQGIQMSVMNDRPQGGSAYINGRIELMILRRLYSDDDLGMAENLNEHDQKTGLGIMVHTRHFLKFSRCFNEAVQAIHERHSILSNPLTTAYTNQAIVSNKNMTFSYNKFNEQINKIEKFKSQYLVYDFSMQQQKSDLIYVRIISEQINSDGVNDPQNPLVNQHKDGALYVQGYNVKIKKLSQFEQLKSNQ
ncbi:glycosyl hydrolases family 38 protein [Stylonychia lemnae]|uniref:Glycosyl hydrolases family 38 protein n=1 Tax=Stylonychia lemnae TaxID=5949 RepID=A0A078APY1_STYLE|nr:glycosyl hydrolases family 38 protein [Stylonychia lemnae]|eukprot:CDW84390.1 glycosyl hydrolases family 38 protein [Stylonychia lemnae]